eukprot:COSAG01_NODE_9708_length_2364_cov_3.562914_2_plen_195_part_00
MPRSRYRQMGFAAQGMDLETTDKHLASVKESLDVAAVSRPFPSWIRFILAEIYLCHACSCQEILRTETAGQGDLERAFRHFLENRPDRSRPFVVAAHSQGAILMTRVLATQLQGTEHEEKLVAAYLCGAYCPKDLFGPVLSSIRACTSPSDTQCVIAYDTRTAAFRPESLNHIVRALGFGLCERAVSIVCTAPF